MARIVGGFGSSHAPSLHSPPERWGAGRGETERIMGGGMVMDVDIEAMIRERAGWIDAELTIEKKRERSAAAKRAIETLGDTIRRVAPDVAIIVGDDTHEIFMPEDHIPAVDVYWGERATMTHHRGFFRFKQGASSAFYLAFALLFGLLYGLYRTERLFLYPAMYYGFLVGLAHLKSLKREG